MISGTIYNAGKMMKMTQKWERKKESGNILKKDNKELSEQEQELQIYQEQLEETRKSNEYSAIYNKMSSGQKLSPAEEEILKSKDPKTYMEYKADQQEQAAYEKKLKNCKTKEEAEKLHQSKVQGNLSELKEIVNNPNIPKSEKLRIAQRIQGDTVATTKIYYEFTESDKFKNLPTEQELQQARQKEHEKETVELLDSATDKDESVSNSVEEDSKNVTEEETDTEKTTSPQINMDNNEILETEVLEKIQKLKNEIADKDENRAKINVRV